MEWYQRYKIDVAVVFREAQARIAQFPFPLSEVGLKYAEKFNPVDDNEGGKDYICVLLPFWMKEMTKVSGEHCERLALANIYGMLYFFIQDDVMDSTKPDGLKSQLSLANLLQLEMFAIFRELFPSVSPFWTFYDRYVTTWADCVMNENDSNYFMTDPIRTAGKAGPVKISAVGACLLAGEGERIPQLEDAIDTALMTLQMLDDWADWQEDLEEGSYNGLLALIASETGLAVSELTVSKIESSVHVLGVMSRYAEIAVQSQNRLLPLQNEMPSLFSYHLFMIQALQTIANHLEDKKRKLLGGGFNYLFS